MRSRFDWVHSTPLVRVASTIVPLRTAVACACAAQTVDDGATGSGLQPLNANRFFAVGVVKRMISYWMSYSISPALRRPSRECSRSEPSAKSNSKRVCPWKVDIETSCRVVHAAAACYVPLGACRSMPKMTISSSAPDIDVIFFSVIILPPSASGILLLGVLRRSTGNSRRSYSSWLSAHFFSAVIASSPYP